MNLVNRTLIVLELLIAFVASLVLILALFFWRVPLGQLITPTVQQLTSASNNISQFVCGGVLLLVMAFSLLLLLLQFQRPASARLKVESVEGAEVSITADAIIQRLEYEIDAISGVIKAHPHISTAGHGKPVDVVMELLISPEAVLATKTQEVTGVIRQVIEDRLGLKVGKVQVKVDHAKIKPAALKKVG